MSNYLIEDSSASISVAVHDWLEAEVNSSNIDRSRFLDEYNKAVEGLKGGWDHPDNYTAIKLQSHLDRLPLWYEAFTLVPENDFQIAKLAFAGLMQVSGSYRNQCYVEANGKDDELRQEDYLARRQRIIGINIQNTVRRQLSEILPEAGGFSDANISIERLGERIEEISAVGRTAVSAMSNRIKQGYDLGVEGSVSAHKMQEAQALWLAFTTDCISLAAKKRKGRLEAVLFLEPRSISDQSGEVYYPMAETVNWAEVLASS